MGPTFPPENGTFHSLGFGRIPPDPEPVDPELRSLDSTGGRMIGSYTNTRSINGDGSLTVSWSICREGVTCAAAPTAGDIAISLGGDLFELDLAVLRDSVADPKLAGSCPRWRPIPALCRRSA